MRCRSEWSGICAMVMIMILKYCTKCKKIMLYNGHSLCSECFEKRHSEYIKRKNMHRTDYKRYNRDKKSDQFYHSKKWKQLSKSVLAKANYKCAICGKLAVEVHHIKEISTDWDKRFDVSNLMPLCTSCHNKQRRHPPGR